LMGIALSTAADWWRAGRRPRDLGLVVGAAALALVPMAGLGASWSRGGWMGFGVAATAMIVLVPRRSAWGAVLVSVIGLVGGGLYATGRLPQTIVARLTGFLAYVRFQDVRGVGVTDATFAVVERMAHWQAALAMWRDHFWLGVGLGCYEPAYPVYRLLNWRLPLGHAHNAYLNMAAEVGLIGLVAYLVWAGVLLIGSVVAVWKLDGWRRRLALGLVGAWVHLAVHSLVDNLLVNNVHVHVGVLAALTAYVLAAAQGRTNSVPDVGQFRSGEA
ncbi:MAG: O-antigen ligase family protein, partial [Anaerolineae bacterium]|nr:O-antigen ligase family protein [Anaerolineae bacterium]